MLSRPVVLVVEDHELIRLAALDFVGAAGFERIGAKSADEAIRILETRPDIRLVFTDVEMPGTMDGLKLAHYIRDRWPPVHLILVSGKVTLNDSQIPTNSTFFPKPYDENIVLQELTRLLSTTPQDRSSPKEQTT